MKTYEIRSVDVFPDGGDLVDMTEEEFIVGGEWSSGNRFSLVIARPVQAEFECGAPTDGDAPCQITVDGPEERCHIHA